MKKLLLVLTAMLVAGSLWAEISSPWSYTFDSSKPTVTDNTFTVNEAAWTYSLATPVGSPAAPQIGGAKKTINNVVYYYSKFGESKDKYYPSVTLTTDAFAGYSVTEVEVILINNGKKAGSISATQGAVTIGSESSLEVSSTANTTFTLSGNAGQGGSLSITYSTAQAFYINSIRVTFQAIAGSDPSVIVANRVELPYTASNAQLSVTYNQTDAETAEITLYTDAECTSEAADDCWLEAEIQSTTGAVAYTAAANTTHEARTIYGVVCSLDESANIVCSEPIVFVQEAAPIQVTGISIEENVSLGLYTSQTLVPVITPTDAENQNVTWESDNSAVVKVTNGIVYGLAVGTANITVTTADGGYTATCVVTVTEKVIPEGTVFYESFDDLDGKGGNDGLWSNFNEAPALGSFDNEGWATEGQLFSGAHCVSIRKNSDTSLSSGLTTPAIGVAGNGRVEFLAESWGTDGSNFFVDIVGGGSFIAGDDLQAGNISNEGATAKVLMAKAGKWTKYVVEFEGLTAESQFRFYAPAGKRAFLDEVAIWVEEEEAVDYYMVGSEELFGEEGMKMTDNEDNTYSLTLTNVVLAGGDYTYNVAARPVVEEDAESAPRRAAVLPAEAKSFTLEAGTYSLKFDYNAETGELTSTNMSNGFATGIDEVEAASAKKLVRDGKIVIIKNGVEYSVLGQKL